MARHNLHNEPRLLLRELSDDSASDDDVSGPSNMASRSMMNLNQSIKPPDDDGRLLKEISEIRQRHKALLNNIESEYLHETTGLSHQRAKSPSRRYKHHSLSDVSYYYHHKNESPTSSSEALEEIDDQFNEEMPPLDYTPMRRAISYSSLSSRSSGISSGSISTGESRRNAGWKPKVTIPVPFSLSFRTAPKTIHCENATLSSTPVLEEVKPVKFIANPVPPTTYLPIYDDLEVKQMLRKAMRTANDTSTGANARMFNRRQTSTNSPKAPVERRISKHKAKVEEKPRDTKLSASRMRHQMAQKQRSDATNMRRSKSVPDFYTKQRAFEDAMDNARNKGKRTTVCQPFHFHQKQKPKIPQSETHSAYRPTLRKTKSLNFLLSNSNAEVSWNRAAMLRAAALRKKINEERAQHLHEHSISDDVRRSLRRNLVNSISQTVKNMNRLEKLREIDRERMTQYEEDKAEMERRLMGRPTLIQRQKQLCRMQGMERKYKETLEKAGLTFLKLDLNDMTDPWQDDPADYSRSYSPGPQHSANSSNRSSSASGILKSRKSSKSSVSDTGTAVITGNELINKPIIDTSWRLNNGAMDSVGTNGMNGNKTHGNGYGGILKHNHSKFPEIMVSAEIHKTPSSSLSSSPTPSASSATDNISEQFEPDDPEAE